MPITLRDCHEFIDHTLAGMPEQVVVSLSAQAGHLMVGMRRWKWLFAYTPLSVTQGDQYIALPTDFGGVLTIEGQRDYVDGMHESRPELIARDYRLGTAASYPTRYAVVPDPDTKPTRDRLWIYPPADETLTDRWNLAYFRKWVQPTTQDELYIHPEWCDALYWELLMHVVRGRDEEDAATLDQRLQNIRMGEAYRTAKMMDARSQRRRGVPRKSLAVMIRQRRQTGVETGSGTYHKSVADPS